MEQQLKNMDQAFLDFTMNGQAVPVRFSKLSEDLQADAVKLINEIQEMEEELFYQSRNSHNNLSEEWQKIKTKIYNLDEESRLLIRQLIKQTFKRITIYTHGSILSDSRIIKRIFHTDENSIDIILTFHNDKTRFLSIDKKTGKWIKGGDIDKKLINEKAILQSLAELSKP